MKKGKKKLRMGAFELRALEFTERLMLLLLLLWLFFIPFGSKVRAAESSVVEKLGIHFDSRFGGAEEVIPPDITVSEGDVEILDIHYRKSYAAWVPGQKLRVDILLKAKDGKVFSKAINRDRQLVDGATLVGAKHQAGDTLLLSVDYIPRTVLGNVEEANWNHAHTMGIWKKVRFAPSYTVRLYGDDKLIQEIPNIKTPFFDFTQYMTDLKKTYYYEVKATPSSEEEKKYIREGKDYTIASTNEVEEPKIGDTDKDAEENEDNIENYLLEGNGVALNSWRYYGRKWYFIDEQGKLKKGWLERKGEWFYLNRSTGAMMSGLVETDKDKFAFFRDDGVMLSNTWVNYDPNTWYLFGMDGYMFTGWWKNSRGEWFYLNKELGGRMQTGWLRLNEKWYFMNQNGCMQTGFQSINGKLYYFNEDGVMLSDTVVSGKRLGADGAAM